MLNTGSWVCLRSAYKARPSGVCNRCALVWTGVEIFGRRGRRFETLLQRRIMRLTARGNPGIDTRLVASRDITEITGIRQEKIRKPFVSYLCEESTGIARETER